MEIQEEIKESLTTLENKRKMIDARLAELLKSNDAHARKAEILESVVGIGPVVTSTLIAQLPELGTLRRGEIAKLVGVAPMNNDSGEVAGKRRTTGGRSYVRRVLYMGTLVAIRHNQRMKIFYQQLVARGKCKKVAIVATMRKLLTILNAMVKSDALWQDKVFPTRCKLARCKIKIQKKGNKQKIK